VRPRHFLVAALLSLYGFMALSSIREKSTTFDEVAHLTAGYSYWLPGAFRMNPELGIVAQRWASLPLLVSKPQFPDSDEPWWRTDSFVMGRRFFYEEGNDYGAMLRRGRTMIVVLAMALGGVIYLWSSRLFGTAGGLLSLTLFTFSPTLLGHGRLVTADLVATLMFTLSLGLFWKALHRARPGLILASGLSMGLLFASKMSAVVVLPTVGVLMGLRVVAGRPAKLSSRRRFGVRGRLPIALNCLAVLAVHGVLSVATVWVGYGLRSQERVSEYESAELERTVGSFTGEGPVGDAIGMAQELSLLPEPFLYGFAYMYRFSRERPAFLNGAFSVDGFPSFFPYAFLAKTPPAVLLLFIVAIVFILSSGRLRASLYRSAPLWAFFVVYWLVALTSHLNIGQRHLLPIYPVMFILCGALARSLQGRIRYGGVLVLVSVLHLVFESVSIRPHYLAYFSPLVGGPDNGYRHLVDSSLDWGQDLPGLRRYVDSRRLESGTTPRVFLSYFGTGDPDQEGVQAVRLASAPDWRELEIVDYTAGTYCISATMLQGVYGPAPAGWTEQNEASYSEAREAIEQLESELEATPGLVRLVAERHPVAMESVRLVDFYEQLRLARLSAFLRQREPDDHVGYSILIYHLSEADITAALGRR